MICSKCGQECADDIKFCTNCGEELVAETQAENVTEAVVEVVEDSVVKEVSENVSKEKENVKEDKKDRKPLFGNVNENMSKMIMIGAAAVAVLVVLIIVIAALGSKGVSYMKVSEKSVYEIEKRDGDLYAVYTDGKQVKLDDENAYNETYSMDGSVVAYQNEDDELVIIREGKVIATGIDEAKGIVVSNEGDTIAYFTDCEDATYYDAYYERERSIKVGTLNLYDVKKKSSIEIAEEVVVYSAVLSPDGRTVAYVAEYEATDDFRGFYSIGGKDPVEVGKEKRVFAIADKAKYVYYTDLDRVYVMKKNNEEKLASDLRDVEVMMNADNSEILFFMDGKTYISVKGGEKKKIAGTEFTRVVLEDDAASGGQTLNKENGTIEILYTGVDTFAEKLLYSYYSDEIYFVMKKFEAEKLASNVYQYVVAEDGESLVYRNDSDVVKVTKFDKGGEKQVIASKAYPLKIYADGDLKHVYILNYESELYYVEKKKGKKVADDVTSAVVSSDGTYCYYIVDEEDLCYSKNGGKEKELLTVDDGDLYLTKEKGNVYVEVSEDDVYSLYNMDGKKMKEIYSVDEEQSYDEYIEDALEDVMDYYD